MLLASGYTYAQNLTGNQVAHSTKQNTKAPLTLVASKPNNNNSPSRVQAGTDMSVTAIVKPVSNCGLTGQETVVVTLKNTGTDTVFQYKVGYILNTADTVLETVNDTLLSGASVQYAFDSTADFSAVGSYNLKVVVLQDSDKVTNNNSIQATVAVTNSNFLETASIISGFEASDNAGLFSTINGGDNNTWMTAGQDRFPRTGKRHASCFIQTAGTPNNDYLVSNCLELVKGAKYKVNFWYRGNISGGGITGKVAIMLGSSATDSTKFKTVLFKDENVVGEEYREAIDTFTVPETGGYRLAIRDYSETSTSNPNGAFYTITIDDYSLIKLRDTVLLVSTILSPKTACDLGDAEAINLELTNSGSVPVVNPVLSFKVGTNPAILDTFIGTIAPGAVVNHLFTATADLNPGTSFNLTASTNYTLLGEEGKQTITEVASAKFNSNAAKYVNAFEAETDLVGWEILDEDKDKIRWGRAGQFAYEGVSCMVYNGGANTSNDWLFSKCLELKKDQKYYVRYAYAITPSGSESPIVDVTLNNQQHPDSLVGTESLITYDESTGGDYLSQDLYNIRVPVTDSYYIGFHVVGEAAPSQVLLDSFFVSRDLVSSIDKNELYYPVSVYPNPVKDVFNIKTQFVKANQLTIDIIDAMGRVVSTYNYSVLGAENFRLDISAFEAGVYTLRMNAGDVTNIEKFMIVK